MDGSAIRQRLKIINGMSYADTQKPGLINYGNNPRGNANNNLAGTVNAQAYLDWLNSHNYNINMTVQ